MHDDLPKNGLATLNFYLLLHPFCSLVCNCLLKTVVEGALQGRPNKCCHKSIFFRLNTTICLTKRPKNNCCKLLETEYFDLGTYLFQLQGLKLEEVIKYSKSSNSVRVCPKNNLHCVKLHCSRLILLTKGSKNFRNLHYCE